MTHVPAGATPHLILLASFLAAFVLQVALALAARAGLRPPALLWLAPSIGLMAAGREATTRVADASRRALAEGDPLTFAAEGAHAWSAVLAIDGLAYGVVAGSLLLTAWLAAFGHVAGAGPRARARWVRAAPSLAVGILGAGALAGIGALLDATTAGTAFASVLLTGQLAGALTAAWRSSDLRADQRLCAGRGLVMGSSLLALVVAGVAGVEMVRADAWLAVAASGAEARPAILLAADATTRAVVGVGLLGAGITAVAGACAVLMAPRGFGAWRTVLSALTAAALMVGAGVARVVDARSLGDVAISAHGGAIGWQPAVRLADLPRAEDLAGRVDAAPPAHGTCFVVEGGEGWQGEPLHPMLDTAAWILGRGAPGRPVPELERHPGCPPRAEPLAAPLSTYEQPVVAVQANRLAPAITGHRWFLERGTLRLLLAPPDAQAGLAPWSQVWRTVELHWEMPPDGEPLGDGDEHWDFEAATRLPVTLIEGRTPILLAGGSREALNDGPEAAERLRDALLGSPRRDLVLVPRKHWTIQDLVRFCLTARVVPGARCVVRPESPAGWSERTGLPLPWTAPD